MGKIGDIDTLHHIADEWSEFPITNLEQAASFLRLLHTETDGWVIVDFLDASNWDLIDSWSHDPNRGLLQINWRDFLDEDKSGTISKSREMSMMAFPASLYGMIMRFQSIELVQIDKLHFFAFRGYSMTDKEIKKALKPDTEEFHIREHRPFSREIILKTDWRWKVIDFINSALFAALIVPKDTNIPAHASKTLLYQHNLRLVDETLSRAESSLGTLNRDDAEGICEKANTIRRNMESILKIECCYREIELRQTYRNALLGDLWGGLKSIHSESIQNTMSRFIEWANEFSHDTGTPVERVKVEFIAMIARMYARFLMEEIMRDWRYSRFRRQEEDYISF
jgi:hypothetical protein